MDKLPFFIIIILLFLLLISVIIINLFSGSAHLTSSQILKAIAARIPLLSDSVSIDEAYITIVWDFRIARCLVAAFVGASLGIAGAAFQGLFRNPLAAPYVIGASSGAAFGATLAIVVSINFSLPGFGPIQLLAFAGSIGAVFLAYLISQSSRGLVRSAPPIISLLLAGTALSAFFSSGVSLIMAIKLKDLHRIYFWLLGSLSTKSWPHLFSIIPWFILSFILLLALSRPLDLLAFPDETACGMGLDIKKSRILIIGAASVATAAAVANSGIIGFIGLVSPHLARLLFGPKHKKLIPVSAFIGAILLVLADNFAKSVMAPRELPVGAFTAILGVPFFLFLLWKRGGSLTSPGD